MNFKKLGLFAAGTLFGTAGIKVLTSKDARKVYTEVTAAALRAKECVMTTVTNVQESAGDILADAKVINDQRAAAAEAEVVEDAAEASATLWRLSFFYSLEAYIYEMYHSSRMPRPPADSRGGACHVSAAGRHSGGISEKDVRR